MSLPRPMQDRLVVVTGANSGVGLATSRALAVQGARVVLAVRNRERGEAARRDILGGVPDARVEVLPLDLARLDDVRRFAADFAEEHPALDVLVNNAGVHMARRELTPDGHETTFAVNHLGHFLLTNLLLPQLERAATASGRPSRVVTVASDAHYRGTIDFDDLMGERRWGGLRSYCQSKLANVLFALELARRVDPARVTSNALHPGVVRTNWARGEESGIFRFGVALSAPFMLSPEKGARTSIHLASSPEVEGVSGRYFRRCRAATPSREARDPEVGRRLWSVSQRLCGVA